MDFIIVVTVVDVVGHQVDSLVIEILVVMIEGTLIAEVVVVDLVGMDITVVVEVGVEIQEEEEISEGKAQQPEDLATLQGKHQ